MGSEDKVEPWINAEEAPMPAGVEEETEPWGGAEEVPMLAAEEEEEAGTSESAAQRFDTRIQRAEDKTSLVLAMLFALVVAGLFCFAFMGLIVSVNFSNYASHHYVKKNLAPLEESLEKQQAQLDLLLRDMVDRCIDAFLANYLDLHPAIIVEPDNEYTSAVLEGVRVQAVTACTPAE